MSHLPDDLKYLSSHEWLRLESDGTAYVGISDYAQESMGDLVYVECPEVGTAFGVGDEAGVVESVKAASDIYCPVGGEVVSINERLEDNPELVNQDPYGEGWIFQIKVADTDEVEDMLGADEYLAQIEE